MSATTVQHPSAEDVSELMHGLLGLAVKTVSPPDPEIWSIAEYADDTGAPVGYIGCDLAGGCRLGAALTQVPAGRVDEAVADGEIPDALAENLDEIFNICVNLIAPSVGGHVALKASTHGTASEASAALKTRMAELNNAEFGIDVARYGVCRIVVAL